MNKELREVEYDFPMQDAPVPMGNDAHQEQSDGSSVIHIDFPNHINRDNNLPFNGNIATALDGQTLQSIANYLCEAIQADKDSREQWETRIAASMDQLGLQQEDKTFPFDDASSVTSAAFMQSILAAEAALSAEILPPSGPAKIEIVGDPTIELEDRANRVEKWMNLFTTQLDKSFYSEIELALQWAIFIGSSFIKVYQDPILNKPCIRFIKPQDLIVNYGISSLDSATRITQQFYLTAKELKLRQLTGIYCTSKVAPQDDLTNDQSEIQQKLDSVEGFETVGVEYNKKYAIYEAYVEYDIPGFEDIGENGEPTGLPLPYIFTIDIQAQKILAIYRNWEEGDATFQAKQHFVHFKYLQGFGFYGLGLAQVCGGNAEAATKITNQLIDAGTFANFTGGVRAKGLRFETNTVRAAPGEFPQVDLGDFDDIRKVMMPFPANGPSMELKSFKDDLEENIRQLAGAGTQQIPDFNPNAPVGTTLALIENAQKMQSSVVRRIHRAMGEVLQLVYDIFSVVLPDGPYPYSVAGQQQTVMKQDFTNELNIVPVSDPNLTTSTQRLIRSEAIIGWAKENPDLFNLRNIYEQALHEMKIADVDKILMPAQEEQEPLPLDPISENQNAIMGKPLKAGLTQDHISHIIVHNQMLQQMQAQQLDSSNLEAHIKEHESMRYLIEMQQAIGQQLPEDPSQLPIEMQNQIAMQAADVVSQMQQAQQEQQPAPPIDPAIPMLEEVKVRAMGIEEKSKVDMAKLELEKLKLQIDMERLENEKAKIAVEMEKAKMDNDTKIALEHMKMEIESMKTGSQLALKEREQLFKEAVEAREQQHLDLEELTHENLGDDL